MSRVFHVYNSLREVDASVNVHSASSCPTLGVCGLPPDFSDLGYITCNDGGVAPQALRLVKASVWSQGIGGVEDHA